MKKTGGPAPGTPTNSRHDPAQVRRDHRGRRRGAGRRAVPRRQGAGLRAGAQAALPAVEQLRPRRRRRDRPAGRGVHEGDRDRDHGRDDQPERHGGPDHRRGRERQRRRRDPDERQPAASVRQRSRRPQRARRRSCSATRSYEWARGAATVDGVARGVPLFNIGNAIVYRKDVFEELGLKPPNTWDEYLEVGQSPEEQQPAGRPDARPHLRRRADVRLSVAVELRRPGGRRGRQAW